jgi:hypothetical protein
VPRLTNGVVLVLGLFEQEGGGGAGVRLPTDGLQEADRGRAGDVYKEKGGGSYVVAHELALAPFGPKGANGGLTARCLCRSNRRGFTKRNCETGLPKPSQFDGEDGCCAETRIEPSWVAIAVLVSLT